jgi:hypothetical protein
MSADDGDGQGKSMARTTMSAAEGLNRTTRPFHDTQRGEHSWLQAQKQGPWTSLLHKIRAWGCVFAALKQRGDVA